MQRLLPPLLLMITWAGMILFALLWPVEAPFPPSVRSLAGALSLGGILIAAKGARTFRSVGTNIMTFAKPDKLVTTGLYRWSRNPMYLGFAICALGGAVALNAYSSIALAIAFCITLDRWYIRFEEAVMHRTFGAAFANYCVHVRRWL